MKWIKIQDKEPRLGDDVLFFYRNEVHMGHLINAKLRPVKYVWYCWCCGDLDMEELEYGSSDNRYIQYWMRLPERPNEMD